MVFRVTLILFYFLHVPALKYKALYIPERFYLFRLQLTFRNDHFPKAVDYTSFKMTCFKSILFFSLVVLCYLASATAQVVQDAPSTAAANQKVDTTRTTNPEDEAEEEEENNAVSKKSAYSLNSVYHA